jgi:hypothetical protein
MAPKVGPSTLGMFLMADKATPDRQVPFDTPLQPEQVEKPAASAFNVPALLDGFKSTVGKIGEMPSLFPSAEAILPAETSKQLGEGVHRKPNGSSITVDKAGLITEFHAAPSRDNAAGATFTNIKYDENKQVRSYQAPSGHIFTRTTPTDKDGNGTWMVTDAQGRQTWYAGSHAWTWKGKVEVTEDSFKNSVASGPKAGAEYERLSSGESKVTTAEKAVAQKEAQKIAGKVLDRIEASENPGMELSTMLNKMDNLNGATVSKRADGKYQVDMYFDQATQMPAINANIRGFRPGPTNVGQHVSFALSHTENGVKLDEIQGLSGSVTGPRGRVRPSWNNGMEIGRDRNGTPYVDVDSTVRGPFRYRSSSNRFGEQNFPADSPMRQIMHNPDVLSKATNALRMFQSNNDMQHGSLRRTGADQMDVSSSSLSTRDIPVNQKLAAVGMTVNSIHLERNLSGTISNGRDSATIGNIKGMSVKVQSPLGGEMTVTPKSTTITNNEKGIPIVRLELQLNGTAVPLEIPVSKLKEYRNRR